VNQSGARRTIEETLQLAWRLLMGLPEGELKRIDPTLIARYAGGVEPAGQAMGRSDQT
jgi:vacuolar-type H+-ATPase subunit B/Vma2